MSGHIYIQKPCHENWNKMTPDEQGRHCGACNKVVQDFTKMKTEEIIETLKNTQGEVCGRVGVQKLTPVNSKQKVSFWMNGILRKAAYPIMALLGVSLVTKRSQAQIGHDYPIKGKMDVRNYHTSSKKINVVVKSGDGNSPVPNANITIVMGVVKQPASVNTDSNGRVTLNIESDNLASDEIEIEISAPDFETKVSSIKLTKDIQTIEIRMDYEVMIMGEMMFVPDEKIIEEPNTAKVDTLPKIEVCKCLLKDIVELPLIANSHFITEAETIHHDEELLDTTSFIEKGKDEIASSTQFNLYPNPSRDFVTIESTDNKSFNVDVFDANGKKVHSIINVNQRYLLDLTKYASGVYYSLITVEGKAVETKKIIVSR